MQPARAVVSLPRMAAAGSGAAGEVPPQAPPPVPAPADAVAAAQPHQKQQAEEMLRLFAQPSVSSGDVLQRPTLPGQSSAWADQLLLAPVLPCWEAPLMLLQQRPSALPRATQACCAPTCLVLARNLLRTTAATACRCPAACGIFLLADNIYRAGELLWGVARTALPPRAQRPADVAFWLGFAAILTRPLWF